MADLSPELLERLAELADAARLRAVLYPVAEAAAGGEWGTVVLGGRHSGAHRPVGKCRTSRHPVGAVRFIGRTGAPYR
ncbi:hypothetical protein ACFVRD_45230 [Streptomyces sp. NPDC057908]|uniref:hypothetical protein n=1 Tax=Streptomyces sp. NPDC057908 TaxID=3346276 RepID=UPI0036E6DA9B